MKKSLIFVVLVLLSAAVYADGDDFDCKTLGITIDKCYTQDGIFHAEFSVLGTKAPGSYEKIIDIIDGIEYTVDTEKQYKTINGDIVARGILPEGYKLTNPGGNNYLLEANMGDNTVKSLRVAYTKDDLYEYTHEMEYCYLEASRTTGIKMYGFKTCDVRASTAKAADNAVQENKITAKAVEDVAPAEEKSNILYYAIGGVILLAVVLIFVFGKKKN